MDPVTRHEDADFYADTMIEELQSGAQEPGQTVEETYAGLVGDNVKYNRNALAKVPSSFNWLSCIGCVTRCLDLLCEDLSKISEISEHIGLGNRW